jgi:NADPH2:quinone reductase
MKAVQITKNGGIDVLEHVDIPVPKPSPTQVLIKNEYAGINYIDTYFRTGLYPAPKFPLILGREAAGEVIACGAEANPSFAPGTKVVYMEPGAYAEYSAISAANVVAIPDDVSTETAAAAYLQGLTAWTLIRESAHVQKDQWTLVHAAAGGVGSLLVQMLRGVGAKIIATASSDDKLALAKKYGADYTVNSNDDVVAKVKEITGGHGIDAIFDGVGKATFDADLEMIAMKGNLISFGNAVSYIQNHAHTYLSQEKDLTVILVWSCSASKHPEARRQECSPYAPRSQRLCRRSQGSGKVRSRAL